MGSKDKALTMNYRGDLAGRIGVEFHRLVSSIFQTASVTQVKRHTSKRNLDNEKSKQDRRSFPVVRNRTYVKLLAAHYSIMLRCLTMAIPV